MNEENKLYKNFWLKSSDDEYYVSEPYTENIINSVEKKLGYKIPDSYKTLMSTKNGGLLKKSFFPQINHQGKITKIFRCEQLLGIEDQKNVDCLLGKFNHRHENEKTIGVYDFEMDGYLIGFWLPNSGWGNTYFYLDYSLCGKNGEPEVRAYEMKWSPKHSQAKPIDHFIASNFSEFLEKLIDKPTIEPFNFETFETKLIVGAKESLNRILKDYSPDQISAFGFYTDEANFVSTSIDTNFDRDVNCKFLTSEWTYEMKYDTEVYSELTSLLEDHVALLMTESKIRIFRNQLIDCCANVLLKLKEEGFFVKKLGKEIILMVGTSHSDMSLAKFKQVKNLLNSKSKKS